MSSGGPLRRDGAINRPIDEDVISIEQIDDIPPLLTPRSDRRGKSESQNLLPNSLSKKSNQYSAAKAASHRHIENVRYGRRSPSWSGVPQYLKRGKRENFRDLAFDIVSFCVSLPFFALVGTFIWFDGKEVNSYQQDILSECIIVASTLFPLCFSLIVGRAMIKIASWRLEKGSSLGLLESLLGSQTVTGAIVTQFRLWPLSFVGIGLVLLWCLSPLGSQAILRAMSNEMRPALINSTVAYLNSRQESYSGTSEYMSWSSGSATLLNSAILAPEEVKKGTADNWGNIKIPTLASTANIPEDENGWRNFPSNFTPTYSSLFGFPISNIQLGTTSCNLESTYVELTCSNITSNMTRGPYRDFAFDFYNPSLISTTGPFFAAQNITYETQWAIGYLGDFLPTASAGEPQSLDTLLTNATNSSHLPGVLLYQDFSGLRNVTGIYCIPKQQYVESTVICSLSQINTSPSCFVSQQRASLLPHADTSITTLSIGQIFLGLSAALPNMTSTGQKRISTLQNYLINPNSNTYIQSATGPSDSHNESLLLDIPLTDFATRLSQVINTYIQGTFGDSTSYLLHDISTPQTPLANTPQLLGNNIRQGKSFLTVPSTLSAQQLTHTTSHLWLSLFLLSLLPLVLSPITSAIVTRKTLHRSYIPYISSLFRESENANVPTGGMTMHSHARSRDMKSLRVRLGEVGVVEGGWEIGTGVALPVGRVGIGREGGVDELVGGRLYV